MFGFLKKKPVISERTTTAVQVASSSLQIQLTLGNATAALFEQDDFALGYVLGFNDGILQAMKINDELETHAAILASYGALFDMPYAPRLLNRSMSLQGTATFDSGVALGGKEAFAFVQKAESPMGLATYLHN